MTPAERHEIEQRRREARETTLAQRLAWHDDLQRFAAQLSAYRDRAPQAASHACPSASPPSPGGTT
jgi:hypothetical protein